MQLKIVVTIVLLTVIITGFLGCINKNTEFVSNNEEKAYLHLYEQMDRYKKGNTLSLIQSYVDTPTHPANYTAWVYDNDLVVLALVDRGTPEDISRAKILCDALIWCQENDQNFNDGRIRDGYWANDLKDPSGKNSSIKSPGSGTGNMAWTIIALLSCYEVTNDATHLNASKRLGNWINDTCYDSRGAGGYTGGYEGWEPNQTEFQWKSTEHNIDVYVAFMKLYEATGNHTWRERAIHAKMFVEAMWDEGEGHFWTGTTNDGKTINKDVRPLDVNTWALMALAGINKSAINNWIENNHQVNCCGFNGFDFNDDRDGIWFEGTAQMCLVYQIKNETEKADNCIEELRRAQIYANNNNGKGIVAACHDNVSTGFGWSYSNALHIGATAWYIFVERGLNPYWGISTSEPIPLLNAGDEEFLDTVEFKTFLFFFENTDERGFTIESTAWPIGSSASTGFYLTSIPIAVERGWISYEDGYQRVLTTLSSYYDDPADPDDFYVESVHGFFPHWFDQEKGKWSGVDCFSSIDTAILMAGVLTVRQYFADTEIETVATKLYEDVDWEWMLNGDDTLSMGWRLDMGFLSAKWQGYNEGMLAVLLAMGSPTHPIPEESWDAWARTYRHGEYEHGNQSYKFVESTSTSLFTYQYPHIWFDFRKKADKRGINYFQNSVNATLENRVYCIENPNNHKGYGPNVWGLTACECPLHDSNYGAHGPRQDDDGTIAPAGAGGSIIFTSRESIEALRYMKDAYGDRLWGKYGFKDAFNLDIGWFSPTYIGIDQGAILIMMENCRSGLAQSLFMQNECAKNAMQKAGFTDTDTTPPAIIRVQEKTNKITARIVDDTGVQSVVMHLYLRLGPHEPYSYQEETTQMTQFGQIYSIEGVPNDAYARIRGRQLMYYYIEAVDKNGNSAISRRFLSWKKSELSLPEEEELTLPSDAPPSSLLVDRFDDCISKGGAGAWHGGSSTPEDCVIMFDSSVNRGETGCSMKVRYNVENRGAYNGAWIKLGNLDLREYKELIFWIKGDEREGYTTTFKIELKSQNGQVEYTVRGVTDSWKRITVPLNEFKAPAWVSEIDWSDVTELTIVFEDRRVTDKNGVIYIDDVYFTPEINEEPATMITPTSATTPEEGMPGFEAVFIIAGLLAVAYLLRGTNVKN